MLIQRRWSASRPLKSRSKSTLDGNIDKIAVAGLPDAAVKEQRSSHLRHLQQRVALAVRAGITINPAPADVRKKGPSFDLPIAMAILRLEFEPPGRPTNTRRRAATIGGKVSERLYS
jgi:magnesium chelatase family protein